MKDQNQNTIKQENQKIILEMLTIISTAYQYFQINEHTARIWLMGLKGLNRQVVRWAVYEHCKTSSKPPTIACIRKLSKTESENRKRKLKMKQLTLDLQEAKSELAIQKRKKISEIIKNSKIKAVR